MERTTLSITIWFPVMARSRVSYKIWAGPYTPVSLTNNPSTLTIQGNYTQNSSGTLLIDLAGTGAGQFGVFSVTGLATLDGTVDFNFMNGFTPTKGDEFTFLNFGSKSGDFSSIIVPGFSSAAYTEIVGPNSLTLEFNQAAPVPIPAAVWIFGSGLIGLIGIRRRKRTGINK